MPGPSQIEIAGSLYPLTPEDGLRFVYRSTVAERREVEGAERRTETLENDTLRWRWDTWRGGEGQRWINTGKEGTHTRYLSSSNAVDLDRDGKLRLGLNLVEDLDIGATTTVPFLNVARDQVIVIYDQTIKRKATYSGGDDGWDTVTTTAGIINANIRGPFSVIGNKLFLGNSNRIVRVAVAAGADPPGTWTAVTWVASGGQMPVVSSAGGANALYYTLDGTDKAELYSTDLLASGAPYTPTLKGTAKGSDETMAVCAAGNEIFVAFSKDGERGFLYRYGLIPGGGGSPALHQFAEIPLTFRFQNNLRDVLVSQNGVLFMGGYYLDHGTRAVADPALLWYSSQTYGLVGRIRSGGASEKIKAMFAGPDNKVIMGTTRGRVFAYDMTRGGIYQLASGLATTDDISSITYHEGRYYVGTRASGNSKVWATAISGNNRYPASSKVTSSKWHFDVADEEKLLTTIRVSHSALAAGEKVSVSIELDDGSEVTTDSAGATMESTTTNATSKTFTISDNDTERTCRWARMNVTLTAGTNQATTPTVNWIELRAKAVNRKKYVIARVNLSDDHDSTGSLLSGAKMGAALRTLVENTADRLFTVKLLYSQSQGGQTEAPETLTSCSFAGDPQFVYSRPGEGYAELAFEVN